MKTIKISDVVYAMLLAVAKKRRISRPDDLVATLIEQSYAGVK